MFSEFSQPSVRIRGATSLAALQSTESGVCRLLGWSDASAVIATALFAKFLYIDLVLGQSQPITFYLVAALAMALVQNLVFKHLGLREFERLKEPHIGFGALTGGVGLSFLILLGALYFAKFAEPVSRGWFLSWAALLVIALIVVRVGFTKWTKRLLSSGGIRRNISIIGTRSEVSKLQAEYANDRPNDNISAFIVEPDDKYLLDRELLALEKQFTNERCDGVIIAVPKTDSTLLRGLVRRLSWCVSELSVAVPGAFLAGVSTRPAVGDTQLDTIHTVPLSERHLSVKRFFDVTVAIAALVLLSPVMLIAAAAIRFDSRGPIIFKQKRYGKNNRIFKIFKFRTMSVMEDGDVVTQAQLNDARVTRVGRILRASSVDELPQLFNVLAGDMSVVGPRPHAIAHDLDFEQRVDLFAQRRRVLPGLTGWAQVNGFRGEMRTTDDIRMRLQYDLYYVRNWSMWFDIEILCRTVVTVLRGAH